MALTLAIIVSVLGFFDLVSQQLLDSALLATIAILAFALFRDRWRGEAAETRIHRLAAEIDRHVQPLPDQLEQVLTLSEMVGDVRAALDRDASIRVLKGPEITDAFEEAREHTERWFYKGGTGTYTRAVTLPECVKHVRHERGQIQIRLEIIDPTDRRLCERYATYRTTVREGPDRTGEAWSPARTRNESFATVLAAAWYRQNYGHLVDVDVALSGLMTSYRYDLASSCLLITLDDAAPAIRVDAGQQLYDYWSTELRLSFDQSRRVPLERASAVRLSREPSEAEVRRLFAELDLRLPPAFGAEQVGDIVRRALHARNPYG